MRKIQFTVLYLLDGSPLNQMLLFNNSIHLLLAHLIRIQFYYLLDIFLLSFDIFGQR
jgi:hypothetical protein